MRKSTFSEVETKENPTGKCEVFTKSDEEESHSFGGHLARGHRSIILTSGEGVCTYVARGSNLNIPPWLNIPSQRKAGKGREPGGGEGWFSS